MVVAHPNGGQDEGVNGRLVKSIYSRRGFGRGKSAISVRDGEVWTQESTDV